MGATFIPSAYFFLDAINTYWWIKKTLWQATKKYGDTYLGDRKYWNTQGTAWGNGQVKRNNTVVKTFTFTFDLRGGFDAEYQGSWETWFEISIWFDLGGSDYQCYTGDVIELNIPEVGKVNWTLDENLLLEDSSGGYERTKEYIIRVDISTLPLV